MKNLSLKVLAVLSVFTLLLSFSSCSNDEEPIPTANTVQNLQEVKVNDLPVENAARLLDAGTYSIKRYVFSRSGAAGGLGHVGVGVEIRTTNPTTVRFYNGAVENSTGSFAVLQAVTMADGIELIRVIVLCYLILQVEVTTI